MGARWVLPGCSRHPLSSSSPAPSCQIFRQLGRKGAKVNFFLLAFVFSRDFRRQERAKIKDILKSGYNEGAGGGAGGAVIACLPACPLGAGGAGCRASGGLSWCVPSLLSALSLCPRCIGLKYAFIRVLRGFIWVYRLLVWVCIARVLCVACGAFVCVSG